MGYLYQKLFAEGFRDKVFNTEIVAQLGHALHHKDFNIRSCAIKILTAALDQGVFCCFYGIFILNYSQMGFGTRFLIQRLLLHWDMHYVIKISISEALWSKSSLML